MTTTRIADLKAKLDGRLKPDGNPKPGFKKNVAALRLAIAGLEKRIAAGVDLPHTDLTGTHEELAALKATIKPMFRKPA